MDRISIFILILVETEMQYGGAVSQWVHDIWCHTADCLVELQNNHVAQNKHNHMKNGDFDSYTSCLRRSG